MFFCFFKKIQCDSTKKKISHEFIYLAQCAHPCHREPLVRHSLVPVWPMLIVWVCANDELNNRWRASRWKSKASACHLARISQAHHVSMFGTSHFCATTLDRHAAFGLASQTRVMGHNYYTYVWNQRGVTTLATNCWRFRVAQSWSKARALISLMEIVNQLTTST
eukprot:SAG31_NODE_14449_length_806_cov_0.790665_2_plen_164_part_01